VMIRLYKLRTFVEYVSTLLLLDFASVLFSGRNRVSVQLGSLFLLFTLVDVTPGKVFAATFCSGHKTLAFDLLLIHMIFGAPIMLAHSFYLVIKLMLAPSFTKFTTEEEKD
jgi:hypothetical protein